MDQLELAWETYEFHSIELTKYEELHLSNMKKLKIFKNKKVPPTEAQKARLSKVMLRCCDNLIVHYKKQIDSIKDLINIYRSDVKIPESRETDIQFLNELIMVTATLMEEINLYRSEINEFLN
jgi:hypothetical protein